MAFIEGAIDRPAHLPAGPATADGYRIVSADRAFDLLTPQGSKGSAASGGTRLTITHTELGKSTFGTDRGPRSMPAWMFTIAAADGPVAVLAVAPEAFWFPSGLAGRGQEPYWAGAVVGSDHRTLTVGLVGMQTETGPCGVRYEVKLTESPAAVMVTLIPHPDLFAAAKQSPPVVCTLMGFLRHASATLKAPLGGRVLVDDLGYPMAATGNR
ncbi:MAG: hypothetical protein M3024_00845 [Candidatus Dormibacteraeota bacterium]|nr:hypothetical protein [Candidatus Dormibacteraeota bacterium]